ncbi:aminoglycoside phosphotransferase family protein [Streptomyces sp. NPDC005492]|uniref:aminoglycoside phosphotransferase family protein n=1 Tax=Streptomyces sp. NPDC005492 TaxID=3156883 RepID=UPI0033A75ADB
MTPQLRPGAYRLLLRLFAEKRLQSPYGIVVPGHHNQNRITQLGQPLGLLLGVGFGGVLVKFRTPVDAIEVVPRIWRGKPEVLTAAALTVRDVPCRLLHFDNLTVDAYVRGRVLSKVVGADGPNRTYGSDRLDQMAGFFASLADVPRDALPELPADWAEDRDTWGFLEWQARFTDREVYRPNVPRFGSLFDEVGIPEDAMERFMDTVSGLARRPFSLLHTDVHPGNIVVSPRKSGDRLVVIDWESAMYGDPLHDLATHVVRMGYGVTERRSMIETWARTMSGTGHPEAIEGMEKDLPVYLAFEQAQSVFADVMRAALALPDEAVEEDFATAVNKVRCAVRRARKALRLAGPPLTTAAAETALRTWHAAQDRTEPVCGHEKGARGWDDSWKKRDRGGRPGGGALSGAAGAISLLTWAAAMPW